MINPYWFKPKTYGYGATPITWEGWRVSIAAGALVAVSVIAMMLLVQHGNTAAWLLWAVAIAGLVLGFVRLMQRRTDGEWRWRWGRRANERWGR